MHRHIVEEVHAERFQCFWCSELTPEQILHPKHPCTPFMAYVWIVLRKPKLLKHRHLLVIRQRNARFKRDWSWKSVYTTIRIMQNIVQSVFQILPRLSPLCKELAGFRVVEFHKPISLRFIAVVNTLEYHVPHEKHGI